MKAPADWRTDTSEDRLPQVWPLDDVEEHVIDGHPCWCEQYVRHGVIFHTITNERETLVAAWVASR